MVSCSKNSLFAKGKTTKMTHPQILTKQRAMLSGDALMVLGFLTPTYSEKNIFVYFYFFNCAGIAMELFLWIRKILVKLPSSDT